MLGTVLETFGMLSLFASCGLCTLYALITTLSGHSFSSLCISLIALILLDFDTPMVHNPCIL